MRGMIKNYFLGKRERLHVLLKGQGAGFRPCLTDFYKNGTTSKRGPKTENLIGKVRQPLIVHDKIYPCLA